MSIQLTVPTKKEMKPRIVVFGVGGAGGNAVNNMISAGLEGVEFVVANTDAQALSGSAAERQIQMGAKLTEGLGAGSDPDVGRAAAEESIAEISDMLQGAHMAFVTAGMGGGTGTGAAPVVARAAREQGILTVGVVTKPFDFEGKRRASAATDGIEELSREVDTLIIIPNQNLFRIANAQTTFAEAFGMADEVLYSGVSGITDLMVKPGLINLDFADVKSVMNEMGKAMMGTGEAEGENRAIVAAEAAIANPLLDDVSMKGARGVLISITGGADMTLYEHDEAANRIREEVDLDANIIIGSTLDESMHGSMRVSVVATGIDAMPAKSSVRVIDLAQTTEAREGEAQPSTEALQETQDAPSIAAVEPALDEGMANGVDVLPETDMAAAEVSAELAQPAEDTPHMADDDLRDVPKFLSAQPMAAPRREPTKRTRGFLSRVLPGRNKTPETDMAVAESPEAPRSTESAVGQKPAAEAVASTPDMRAETAAEVDLELKSIEAAMKKPARAVRKAAPKPAEPVQTQPDMIEPVSAPIAETVVAQEPAIQTTMQTVSDTKAGFDQEQLDIPAFLRR